MVKFYNSLNETKQNVFWLLALTVLVFLALCPLFVISQGAYPLGWLLGSLIGVVGYLSISYGTGVILKSDAKVGATVFTAFSFFLRFFLYAAGLVIGAICTFKPQYFGGFNAFNIWTVFAGYLPLCLIMPLRHFISLKKQERSETIKQNEEGSEEK